MNAKNDSDSDKEAFAFKANSQIALNKVNPLEKLSDSEKSISERKHYITNYNTKQVTKIATIASRRGKSSDVTEIEVRDESNIVEAPRNENLDVSTSKLLKDNIISSKNDRPIDNNQISQIYEVNTDEYCFCNKRTTFCSSFVV